MADVNVSFGLDASELFSALKNASATTTQTLNKLEQDAKQLGDSMVTNMAKGAGGIDQSKRELTAFIEENKKTLVAMQLNGESGSKAYKIIEDEVKKAKAEIAKLDDAAKQVDQSLGQALDGGKVSGFSGALGGLKDGLTSAFSGGLIGGLVGGGIAGAVQTGIGAVVSGFGAVIDSGRALISAQGDLQAQTGATGAEFEALKKEAEDAFLGGVGESAAEATKVIANAKVVLKDALPTDQIGEFTAKAQALGNLYEKDVNEVIAKSTPFIKQFGLQGDEAFNLIALAAKEGKTSQDDVLDTLAEYSQLLDEAGFSAEEFVGALTVAGQEGLFNTDKIADSIKEAQIRLKAGDTAKAFADIQGQLPKALGTTLGSLEKLASSGQISIKEFLQRSGESIKTAFDSGQISEAMASQLQVAVAGTPAEDIGVQAYNKLFGAPIPTEEITKKATEAGQAAQNAVGQYLSFDAVGRNLSLAFEKASGAIVRVLSGAFGLIANAVGPTFERLSNTIGEYFSRISSVVTPILAVIGGGIIATISNVLNVAMTVLDVFYNVFISIFDNVAKAIEPIVTAFTSLGTIIADALGFGGQAGQSFDFLEAFQNLLSQTGEVISFVGGIISDVLGGAISFLLTPLQLLGQGIGAVIGFVVNWIKESGVLQAVIDAVTGTIDFFQEIIYSLARAYNTVMQEIDSFLEIFNFATDSVNGGRGVFAGFQAILDSVYNAVKGVAEAIFNFGSEVITKYFIEPIKTAIDWVGQIINKIVDWVKSLPGVQKAIEVIQNIIEATGNFFSNIDKLITGVKANIAGVIFAVGEVGKIAKAIWDDILSLNFQGVIDKIGEAPKRIAAAFKEGKTSAEAFIASQNQVEKQAEKTVLKKVQVQTTNTETTTKVEDDKTKDKDTKDKDKEKQKTKDTETEFQKRLADYKRFADTLEITRDSEFANFTEQQKKESAIYQERLKSDTTKLNEFLNTQFQGQATEQFINAPVTVKPEGTKESETTIQKFYVDTFLKNKGIVDKLAAEQLKDQLKAEEDLRKQQVAEAEKQYKELSDIIANDIKQNTAALASAVPNVGAITQAQYEEATKNADGYIETLRIKNKFIEDQLTAAQIAGADKAAEALQKQLDANGALLTSAEQRLNEYIDASEVSLQNSTLVNIAALAVQKGLYDTFLNDKTQAEREQAEQARQDKLNALRQEEDDLETSLANREISFDEYQTKVGEIADQRRAAEAEGEQQLNQLLANLKRAGETALGEIAKQEGARMVTAATDKQNEILKAENELAAAQRALNRTKATDEAAYTKAQEEVAEKTKALAAVDEQTYGFRTAVLEEFTGKAIEQFGVLAASGSATLADAGRVALGLVVDLLKKQIPVWVASIFGTTVGQLGPAGLLVVGGLTAGLYALANEATAGFKTGGYTGDAGTDEVAGVVHGQEYVLNADATKQNRDVLEWANKTNRPISEYFRSHSLEHKTYSVNDSGELIFEVQKLREETRNLGVQIRRNTTIEVHGNLVGDGRSINAIIENNKRKSIRRG